MDYPNLHRKLFSGSAEKYTETWRARLDEAREAGIHVGVIAVLHQGSLDIGAEAFTATMWASWESIVFR